MHAPPELAAAIIASGSIDLDQGDPRGSTPLMYCSLKGRTPIARLLLDKGADVRLAEDDGFSALHISAQAGHLGMSKLLLKAGAQLEARTSDGSTPLHLASQKGNLKVMRLLIEAGANVDSRLLTGATPLYLASEEGEVVALGELLRAKANPQLISDGRFVPLDMATQNGDTEVVRELVGRVGVKGCGGDSCGVQALRLAAEEQHVAIMLILAAAGVVDTGAVALCGAAEYAREESLKLLLRQYAARKSTGVRAYVNARDPLGVTPLLASVAGCHPGAHRVARILVEAGADTAVAAPVSNHFGMVIFSGTPLALATKILRAKEIDGEPATEQQLLTLGAIRRLLLTAKAVHAASWLWTIDAPRIAHAAAEGATTREQAPSAPLLLMLPALRRRAGNRGFLLADLFR